MQQGEKQPLTPQAVRDRLLKMLQRREHSAAELRDKLARRARFDPDDFDTAMAYLQEAGLQSDARCAEWCLHRVCTRGSGPLKLQRELSVRRLDEALLGGQLHEVDWNALALRALQRRFGEQRPDSARVWQRQYRFLAGRGFLPEQIQSALREPPEGEADAGHSPD
ncbi:MAG: regulatory protein RecX [Gammaproteobacteria bacterium AqS3]|nr:regulatory protein RecX [Gammaproteobacteria bacterium AqS3]